MLLDETGELAHFFGALGGGDVAPDVEGAFGGLDGAARLGGAAVRNRADDRARGRVCDVNALSRISFHPSAIDEVEVALEREHCCHDNLLIVERDGCFIAKPGKAKPPLTGEACGLALAECAGTRFDCGRVSKTVSDPSKSSFLCPCFRHFVTSRPQSCREKPARRRKLLRHSGASRRGTGS